MTTMDRNGVFRLNYHINEEDLELYALGRISGEDRLPPIEEHLLVCHECQDRLAREDEFVREIRAALRSETDADTPNIKAELVTNSPAPLP